MGIVGKESYVGSKHLFLYLRGGLVAKERMKTSSACEGAAGRRVRVNALGKPIFALVVVVLFRRVVPVVQKVNLDLGLKNWRM